MDITWIEQNQILRPLFETMLWDNSLGHYLLVIVSVILVYSGSKTVSFFIKKHAQKLTSRTRNQIDDAVLDFFHRSLTFILVLAVAYTGLKWLVLPESMDNAIHRVLFILLTIKITAEFEKIIEFIVKFYLIPLARKQQGFMKTFIPPILNLTRFIVWSVAFLLILNNLGYNITSLVAGLGIGGIALALAAQETLGNAFGSLSILTDQPFKLNDFVSIGSHQGTVKNVGLRSTQIQALDGTLLSIPNKIVANEVIDNFSERQGLGVKFTLGLEYGTSSQLMKTFLIELRKTINKSKHVDSEATRVHFVEFGDSSLQIDVYYFMKNPKFKLSDYLDCKQEINLKIMELADKLKAGLAFPTQTIHIKNADKPSKA